MVVLLPLSPNSSVSATFVTLQAPRANSHGRRPCHHPNRAKAAHTAAHVTARPSPFGQRHPAPSWYQVCPFPTNCVDNVIGGVSGSASRNARSSPKCLQKSSSILTAYMSCLPLPCSATARLQLETRSIADMHVLNGAFGPDLVKEWSSWIFGHCASNASFLSFRVLSCLSPIPLPSTQLLHQLAGRKCVNSCHDRFVVVDSSGPVLGQTSVSRSPRPPRHPGTCSRPSQVSSGATMLCKLQVVIRSTLKGRKYSPQIAISPRRYTTGCPVRG